MALEACNFEEALFIRARGSIDPNVLSFALSKVCSSTVILAPVGRKRSILNFFSAKVNESTPFIFFNKTSTLDSILQEKIVGPVCLLDSVDLLIRSLGIDNVCKLIFALKENRLIIVSCHESTVSEEEWNRLKSVADHYISVNSCGSSVIANGISFKKNGKITTIKESIEVLPGLKLKSKKHEEALPEIGSSEPVLPSPFDMGVVLKESEKIAKQSLELPYMSSSNAEELVHLRSSDKKVRVGGQIIYIPEKEDDLDDSDPDDDLNL